MSSSDVPVEVRRALYEGVTSGALDAIRAVHRQHPDALRQGWSGLGSPSYLHLAARKGQLDMCRLLVDLGIPVDDACVAQGRCTPLSEAAVAGHLPIVRFLLDAGATADGPEDADSTPLMGAAMEGHREVVQALVAAGADVHRESLRVPQTALDFAVVYAHKKAGHHVEVAEFLRARGAIRPYLEKHDWSGVDQQLYVEHVERALQGFVNPRPLVSVEREERTPVVVRKACIPSRYELQLIFTAGFEPGRRELAIVLPATWPLHDASLRSPHHSAPVDTLAALARCDAKSGDWLRHGGWKESAPGAEGASPWLATLAAPLEQEREGDDRLARTLFIVPFKPRKSTRDLGTEAASRADKLMQKPWKHLAFAGLTAR
ncbi:MAG: ankyrin repeat domain-containing protein [Labilithrix sp.]|nr:ankyrin repeat domain-containing protein [Labilithrix sp.]